MKASYIIFWPLHSPHQHPHFDHIRNSKYILFAQIFYYSESKIQPLLLINNALINFTDSDNNQPSIIAFSLTYILHSD